jgi:hypothetical protein
MKTRKTPAECPVCGEDVPPRAQSCPKCGACHESGWKDDADLDDPDEEFDYEEWRAREEGRDELSRQPIKPFWRWVALAVLIGLFWGLWKWLYQAGSAPLF